MSINNSANTVKKTTLAMALLGGICSGLLGCSTSSAGDTAQTNVTMLRVGGSSEVYGVLEELTKSYSKTANNTEFNFLPPSQTSGGIQGIKSNTIDIGAVSRKITAAEAGSAINYIPLVEVPLVIAVHNSVTGITDITAEQLKGIYTGELSNWKELGGPDADIILFDLAEDENEKQILRQAYLGDALEVTSKAIVFAEDDELVETASVTDFSIAAVPLEDELEELPVSILSIEGVEPSVDNVQSGDYFMTLSLGMILSSSPSPGAEAFVDFISSEEGQQLLAEIETEDDDDEDSEES